MQFPAGAFDREDETDDAAFYVEPRLVTHIDDAAIAALTRFYRTVLPDGGVVADLLSSWVSHYPPDMQFAEFIGHGMNAAELAENPRFTRWFTQDLNADPRLPLDDASLDAATICVSIQYLTRPVETLADIRRCLKPGAPLVLSFSNRCFPTKAVRLWLALRSEDHPRLVEAYLAEAGFSAIETHPLVRAWPTDPMTAVVGRA